MTGTVLTNAEWQNALWCTVLLWPSHNIQVGMEGSKLYTKNKITSTNVTFLCLSSQTCCQIAHPFPQGSCQEIRRERAVGVFLAIQVIVVIFAHKMIHSITAPTPVFSTAVHSKPCFLVFRALFDPSRHNGDWHQEVLNIIQFDLIKLDL